MLKTLKLDEFEKYAEYAYGLALDMSRSSYPTYADGIKTREDFMSKAKRGISGDPNTEILLFESKGSVKGWIHFYVYPEEKALYFYSFCTEENAKEAVNEFLSFAGRRYPGYIMDLGLPSENREAAQALTDAGFVNIETSGVNIMKFENYVPVKENADIIPVSEENFGEFRRLHDPVSHDMYWNSERLAEKYFSEENNWRLYLSWKDGKAAGCIYFVFVGEIMEIFGIDFPNSRFDKAVMRELLIKSLNVSKKSGKVKYAYFFTETAEEQSAALEAGLEHLGDYGLFRGALRKIY